MSVLLYLAITIFMVYLIYAIKTINKVPLTLSDTYYDLGKLNKPKWLFQLAMALTGGLMMPYWIEISPENIQFLAFLACGGLLFVAVAPAFKLELEGTVHMVSAYICGGCAIIWILIMGLWYVPLGTLAIAVLLILLKYKKEKMFFFEMVAFFSSFIALLYLSFK